MKIRITRNIITVLLLSVLIIPGLAYGDTGGSIIPISFQNNHWADKYIDQLNMQYGVEDFFEDKDLNDNISSEDFQILVQKTLKEDFEYKEVKTTRERAVYEFTKIWAAKTEQDLDNIATIKMIIYEDT